MPLQPQTFLQASNIQETPRWLEKLKDQDDQILPHMCLAGFLSLSRCDISPFEPEKKDCRTDTAEEYREMQLRGLHLSSFCNPSCALSLLFTYAGCKLLWTLAVQHSVSPSHSLTGVWIARTPASVLSLPVT